MTLQNAVPGLDYDRDRKFSKSFKEMVAMCLVKDQTKRPTAEKLLKHSFFKNGKPPELTVKSLWVDLPPLWDRVKALELKDAEQLALKQIPFSEQEALSLSEYQRGVSAWNFDIEDLKIQASLIVDDEDIVEAKEYDGSSRNFISNMEPSTFGSTSEKPLDAYQNSDRAEDDYQFPGESSRHDAWKFSSLSGPLLHPDRASGNSLSAPALSFRGYGDSREDKLRSNLVQIKGRFSVSSETVDDVKESRLRRSASTSDCVFNPKPVSSTEPLKEYRNISLPASILMPQLQNLAQQTSFQLDLLATFLNCTQQNDLVSTFQTRIALQTFKPPNDILVKAETTGRERLLLLTISLLQARIISLTDQLTAARLEDAELQQQFNDAYSKHKTRED
ncbi:uncharacterized protein LOC110028197 [Phalaenopsis equestris]|uniref:uncharacterized protein LOC110028197 n=1 Tax=Phalaenopsis equestris TaxID=78828 RepID=UPI0009E1E297|nr:uncharacterized protein LOC110028197 [Phalaenopsis equestris]